MTVIEVNIKNLPVLMEKLKALTQNVNEFAVKVLAKEREERKFALAALDDAKEKLNNLLGAKLTGLCDHCIEFEGHHLRAAILAIDEAIEQLEGRAAP